MTGGGIVRRAHCHDPICVCQGPWATNPLQRFLDVTLSVGLLNTVSAISVRECGDSIASTLSLAIFKLCSFQFRFPTQEELYPWTTLERGSLIDRTAPSIMQVQLRSFAEALAVSPIYCFLVQEIWDGRNSHHQMLWERA